MSYLPSAPFRVFAALTLVLAGKHSLGAAAAPFSARYPSQVNAPPMPGGGLTRRRLAWAEPAGKRLGESASSQKSKADG